MEKIMGKAVHKGIALGPIYVMRNRSYQVRREGTDDVEAEIRKVHSAREVAVKELEALYSEVLQEVGESNAAIFEAQRMLLEDADYQEAIAHMIRSGQVNGAYAIAMTGADFVHKFAGMKDEYLRARAADIRDITDRMLKCFCGGAEDANVFAEPVILVADDLTPGQTVKLDKSKILAFVTVHGSTNSHTAILARTLNIPALVGVNINTEVLENGVEALVNSITGEFILTPTEEQKDKARKEMQKEAERKQLLEDLKGKEDITLSGREIKLYANIGDIDDLDSVLENDAAGVGLFRSEFLYLGRNTLPNEEEQFDIYKKAAQRLGGKKLVVRTLDMGADKQAEYLQLEKEENPALGYRGIRICLTRPDILKTQLRALYRAAVYGNISIMYPMIISTEEVEAIKKITAEVKAELSAEHIPYRDVEEGIMIETPAAAMISDELAGMVDFLSIGTNDLTQYTLAIDRQNEMLDGFYNPHHKAVMKMIRMVTENAHRAGKWVGICGELAADTDVTEEFIAMGIDELSVVPSSILKVRKVIREMK